MRTSSRDRLQARAVRRRAAVAALAALGYLLVSGVWMGDHGGGPPVQPPCRVAALVHSVQVWGPQTKELPRTVAVGSTTCEVVANVSVGVDGDAEAWSKSAAAAAANHLLFLSSGLAPVSGGWDGVLGAMLAAVRRGAGAAGCLTTTGAPPVGVVVSAGTTLVDPCVVGGQDVGPCVAADLSGASPGRADIGGRAPRHVDLLSADCLLLAVDIGEAAAVIAAVAAAGIPLLRARPRSTIEVGRQLLETTRGVRPMMLSVRSRLTSKRIDTAEAQESFRRTLGAMSQVQEVGLKLGSATDPWQWGWRRTLYMHGLQARAPRSLRDMIASAAADLARAKKQGSAVPADVLRRLESAASHLDLVRENATRAAEDWVDVADWTLIGWWLTARLSRQVVVPGGAHVTVAPHVPTAPRDAAYRRHRTVDGISEIELSGTPRPVSTLPAPVAAAVGSVRARRRKSVSAVVAWLLPCCGCCGFVNEAVPIITGLLDAGVDVRVASSVSDGCLCSGIPVGSVERLRQIGATADQLRAAAADTGVILVLHGVPPEYAAFEAVAGLGPADTLRAGFYRVARAMYELTLQPQNYTRVLRSGWIDAIWAPSPFAAEVMARSGVQRRVEVVPEAVNADEYHPQEPPLPLSAVPATLLIHNHGMSPLGSHRFVFLSVFKWEDRKGWRELFAAYTRAFRGDRTVLLLVQSVPHKMEGSRPEEVRHAVEGVMRAAGVAAEEMPDYAVLRHEVPARLMPALYAAADSFVIATRGEGWGLPILQAMASGLPTIAPRSTGQMAFLNDGNSFLVNTTAEDLPRDSYYDWEVGKQWFVPSVPHLAELMREVRSNTARVAAVAREGRLQAVRFGVARVSRTWLGHFARADSELQARRAR
eukprot:TRINITY_DN24853_c0_g1_i1.p1 TRINITY_DN24853_c0_g1~~TRINITY_DN24853_c0_g1_i1.p1  ORF type:complete len:876 (+),score=212.45 TRINITY_DN24853_c0_g1_i1:58-2685(+)